MLNQYKLSSSSKVKMVAQPIDPKLIERKSLAYAAIPILPMPAAAFCFFLNLLVPGLGEIKFFYITISSNIHICLHFYPNQMCVPMCIRVGPRLRQVHHIDNIC